MGYFLSEYTHCSFLGTGQFSFGAVKEYKDEEDSVQYCLGIFHHPFSGLLWLWVSGHQAVSVSRKKKNSDRPDTPSCDEAQNIDTKTLETPISELFQILNKRFFLISFNRQHRLLWKWCLWGSLQLCPVRRGLSTRLPGSQRWSSRTHLWKVYVI